MENTRCVWREHSGYLRRGLHRATNGLINIRIIRSLPVGFFDTGKPQMPLVPDKFFLLHAGKKDSKIRQLWRKSWRKEILTPWHEAQVRTQEPQKVTNLGSTTKQSSSFTRHHGQWA